MPNLFTSRQFMAAPFAASDDLRNQGPLVQTRLPLVGKVWVTTTQTAFASVLKNPDLFSIRRGDGSVTLARWWMPKTVLLLANNMLAMDEPDHSRLRTLVDRAFRRDFISGLEPRIQAIADSLARKMFTESAEPDLVASFAGKLPLEVICELLGIRVEDRAMFGNWAESLTRIDGIFTALKAMRPILKMKDYVAGEIERQRSDPGEGLIGQLVAMQKSGEAISNDEMIAMVFLLLVAGHQTTTHVLSGGIFELLCQSKQKQWLLEDLSRLPLAVEEILRHVSAVQFSKPRNVRRDCMVEGVALKKGDVVMAMIVAANGDPSVIDAPHRLDLSRKPNRHVSFGAGPHFCLGHQLARMEIACALKALFGEYPDLKLAVPQQDIIWISRIGLRVIEKLPVVAE